jgi:hypothetical protein
MADALRLQRSATGITLLPVTVSPCTVSKRRCDAAGQVGVGAGQVVVAVRSTPARLACTDE